MDVNREIALQKLTGAVEEPYFGRIDFQENDQEVRPLYIGKTGLESSSGSDPLVIDWRAPVASLFYSFTGGENTASYDAPDGVIEGLVHLKRNLVIRKRLLQRVVDTYDRASGSTSAVADEFLLYRLGENKDSKLRDIVSTIQAEQDRIIRAGRQTALLIQGVAGSGKTTVALHRLAYLLYQYRDQLRAERMMILAPSRMFLDYISQVLPELGVGHIQQTTFEDWALALLADGSLSLADETERRQRRFACGGDAPRWTDHAPERYKGSLRFFDRVQAALDAFESSFVPDADFEPWPGARCPNAVLRSWFYEEYRHYPLMKRLERLQGRLKRWLEMELESVRDPNVRKERRKKATPKLKTFWKAWPASTALDFYRTLLEHGKPDSPSWAEPSDTFASIPDEVRKASASLRRKQLFPEDLAPLVLIHGRFYGIAGASLLDHVVIDEAQDFSPFQVALLRLYNRGDSFTLLGDLSQGIHAYKGVERWEELLDLFDRDRRTFLSMERSYRSTLEIIRFANVVLARGVPGASQAVPVFRSGEPVTLLRYSTQGDRIGAVLSALAAIRSSAASSIAIIGRTEAECRQLHVDLLYADEPATLIDAVQHKYEGGLSVVSAYFAKGLEFDAVLVLDADETRYGSHTHDAKLLYVACTRALHSLWLLYSGALSPLASSSQADDVRRADFDSDNGFVTIKAGC